MGFITFKLSCTALYNIDNEGDDKISLIFWLL